MLSEKRDKAEQESGEKKSAFINISADTETMKKRADLLAEYGWNYAMIDVVVAGTGKCDDDAGLLFRSWSCDPRTPGNACDV